MNKKQRRLEFIRQIVTSFKIGGQDELLALLSEKGFQSTQATLSRDLKELKIAKMPDEEGLYCYQMHAASSVAGDLHFERRLKDSVSLAFSGNLAVLRTNPGYASAVAGFIDAHLGDHMLGSIAGDDTVFVVMKEDGSRQDFIKGLSLILPNVSY